MGSRELEEMLTSQAPAIASETAPELAARDNLLQTIYLARHGETAWTLTGQHTGITDLPLTPRGVSNARALGERLKDHRFARVFTSPLQRTARTGELAGFAWQAEMDRDLVEWNYGNYEGRRSADIRAIHPNWHPLVAWRAGVTTRERAVADIVRRYRKFVDTFERNA
jgi:broad specificity phosphatase PhoE